MSLGNLKISGLKNSTLDTKVTQTMANYGSNKIFTRNAFLNSYAYSKFHEEHYVYQSDPDFILGIIPGSHPYQPPTCGYERSRLLKKTRTCGDQLAKSYAKMPEVIEKLKKRFQE